MATASMAISTAPRCEIRGLVRHTVYLGRRGKPVRKLQAPPGATVSVI